MLRHVEKAIQYNVLHTKSQASVPFKNPRPLPNSLEVYIETALGKMSFLYGICHLFPNICGIRKRLQRIYGIINHDKYL